MEEKREQLIKKLNEELDEIVLSFVDNKKETQAEFIRAAAPTVDNCIEIIFAISEYGDQLDLSEKEYDKLLNSNHTLLALNDRYVDSEYHANSSDEIIQFVNDFARKESLEVINNYGLENYEILAAHRGLARAETDDKLYFPKEFLKQLDRDPSISVMIDEDKVSVNIAGNPLIKDFPISALPNEPDLYNIDNPFVPYVYTGSSPVTASVTEYQRFYNIYRNTMRDVVNYNSGAAFPDLPGNKSLNGDAHWRIIDKLGNHVLAAAPTPSIAAPNTIQYVVWEYDQVNGGCYHGDYYNAPGSYNDALRQLAQRANIYPRTCAYPLEMDQLSEIVHSDVDSGLSANTLYSLYEKYDQLLAQKVNKECLENGYYPICMDDAERLLILPDKVAKEQGYELCPLYSQHYSYSLSEALNKKFELKPVTEYTDYIKDKTFSDFKSDTLFGIRAVNNPDEKLDFEALKNLLSLSKDNGNKLFDTEKFIEEYGVDISQGGGRK